ncbi:MAG: hypothetical protein ACO1OB_32500 [Archangium sp.]
MRELRVRLEGAWETLESTAECFERAARSLSRGQTDDVARALALRDAEETQRARDAVERIGEPETEDLLARYRTARGAFVEALQARATELGLDGPANRELVQTLETDVLWEGRAVNWAGAALFLGIGIFMGFLSVQRSPRLWFLGPLVGLAIFVGFLVTAPKMKVTKKTVVVGYQSFRIDALRGCCVRRVQSGFGKSRRIDTFIEFQLEQERVERIKVPVVPSGFYTAMNALGLPPIRV